MSVRGCLLFRCLLSLLLPIFVLAGCSNQNKSDYSAGGNVQRDFASNYQPKQSLGDLRVWHPQEEMVSLSKYIGEKNLVLVISRGFAGAVCPFCSAQVQAINQSYSQFTDRNAQVVILFPVQDQEDRSRWEDLRDRVLKNSDTGQQELPFPILVDMEMDVVKRLGIEDELAKPSIFILDRKGEIQYAYVGSDPADRPSVDVVLKRLDLIK